jgi:type I restriction enzyme S subunit
VVTFRTELLGNHITLRKGLSYKGTNLVEESDVGLLTIDAFIAGGGYKRGSEKPFGGGYRPEHIAQAGDVLVAMTEQQEGLLASPLKIPEDLGGMAELVFSLDVAKVISTSGAIGPEFVFNFLRVPLNRARAAYGDTGTTVQRLPYEVIYEQRIPVPSLEEQDRINSFIAILDRKIQLNTSMAVTLEKIAQSVFGSWFVDFDPVKAKMAGEKPVGMNEATAALFPDSMEETELGMTPVGWKVVTLKAVASQRKESIKVKDLSADEVYVDLDSIPRKSLYFHDWKNAASVQSGKTRFCSNDILFGKLRPYFHKVVIAPTKGICSTDIVVVTPMRDELLPFVACLVNQTSFVEFLSHRSTGTRMPRTSWSEMCEFRFACPPELVLNQFGQLMLGSVKKALELQLEIRNIQELRAKLLPRLVSGELQLPEEILVS